MKWEEAADLICQVLKGLEHAHQMGIIHRDIKPANIILTKEGIPKLMDFGIARILETTRLTQAGHLVGTLEYISPEQVSGKETDARSDLYSLGAVFYEMLTGQLPFKKNTDFELMKAQIEEHPQAPSRIVSDIPSPLEKVVLCMLQKTPDKRFPNAAVCFKELERILSATPSKAKGAPLEKGSAVFMGYLEKVPGHLYTHHNRRYCPYHNDIGFSGFFAGRSSKVPTLAAPSPLESGEKGITAPQLPPQPPFSSGIGEKQPSQAVPEKPSPVPTPSLPITRPAPLEKENRRPTPIEKSAKPSTKQPPLKSVSPTPSKPMETKPLKPMEPKPSEPEENKQKRMAYP